MSAPRSDGTSDYFISYNRADRQWAEWVAWQLEEVGFRTTLQAWDFRPGSNFVLEMQRAAAQAEQTIALLSPEYLSPQFTQPEWAAAFAYDPTGISRKLVPLRVRPCELTGILSQIVYIDLVSLDESAARQALLNGVDKSRGKPPTVPAFPGGEGRAESTRPHFPGDDVDAIEEFASSIREHMGALNRHLERLTQDQYRVIRQLLGMRRVRISGCAGSGKTLVAAEKAIRLATAGLRTLFLCHNPLLARHVAHLVQGSGVSVEAFGDWILALAGETRPGRVSSWSNVEEPSEDLVGRAFDSISAQLLKYDAIIVDEGQDFREEWWTIVEAGLVDQKAGIFYIFHDDHQALLPARSSYPIEQPVLDLSRNCRNAGRIFDVMGCLLRGAPTPEPVLEQLGDIFVATYRPGGEARAIARASRWIYGTAGGEHFIVLLGGMATFEQSPFVTAHLRPLAVKVAA